MTPECANCIRLRAAIVKHRDQRADDRCYLDDDELYEVLGDGIAVDRTMPPKEAHLANCARFYDRRCEGGEWITYQELEEKLSKAQGVLTEVRDYITAQLKAEIDTHEVCSKLEGMLPLPDNDEQYNDQVAEASRLNREREANTRLLIERVESLLD